MIKLVLVILRLWVIHLDFAEGEVVVDPGVFYAPRMRCQLLKIFLSLAYQTHLEHENAMVESTNEVVWIYQKSTLELLDCTR